MAKSSSVPFAGPRLSRGSKPTSPATRPIHTSQPGPFGMRPSEAMPVTPTGSAVGAGIELFAMGVQLLDKIGLAAEIRSSLTSACNKVDSRRLVANGGVLIALNLEVSQHVPEAGFSRYTVVKGAYIVGYPENPYEKIRELMNGGRLFGKHRNVDLVTYYIWVTPKMLIERNYRYWPVLAKETIDLSGPTLLMRVTGPIGRWLDKLSAEWARKRAERKDQSGETKVPAHSGGGDFHTYNK